MYDINLNVDINLSDTDALSHFLDEFQGRARVRTLRVNDLLHEASLHEDSKVGETVRVSLWSRIEGGCNQYGTVAYIQRTAEGWVLSTIIREHMCKKWTWN